MVQGSGFRSRLLWCVHADAQFVAVLPVDEIVLIVTSSDTADCRDIVFSRPEMILDSNQANSMIERSAMSPPRSLLESLEFGLEKYVRGIRGKY